MFTRRGMSTKRWSGAGDVLGVLTTGLLVVSFFLLPARLDASAVEKGEESAAAAGVSQEEANRHYFTDLLLTTHEGNQVRFYSDVLRGNTVAINFFYTNCTTVCPPLMGKLSDVQVLLGERLGKGIALVSISVDPERDTPDVIRSYAELFGVRNGWTLLTGPRESIDIINGKLGNLNESAEHHSAVLIVGNPDTGHWVKVAPTASVRTIARQLQLLANEE